MINYCYVNVEYFKVKCHFVSLNPSRLTNSTMEMCCRVTCLLSVKTAFSLLLSHRMDTTEHRIPFHSQLITLDSGSTKIINALITYSRRI